MKKTCIILLLLIYNIVLSKENSAFAGFKLSNGVTMFENSTTLSGIFFGTNLTEKYRYKQYHLGVYFNGGGTIKNISIYSGIGYNLYQYQYLYLGSNIYGIGFQTQKLKLNVINIPFNVDYNLNVYKQKLFVVFGIGTELLVTIKKGVDAYSAEYFNDCKNVSFAVTAKTGLLYSINSWLDCYATFDFSHHVTPYLPLKKGSVYEAFFSVKTYPYNLLASIGLNVKFYKRSKSDETTKSK